MDLLIRSQDRKVLMKIDTLSIALDEEGTILGYGTDGNVKVSLGNYQTEERALEVLDSIDKCMSNAVNNGLNVAHYVMPES